MATLVMDNKALLGVTGALLLGYGIMYSGEYSRYASIIGVVMLTYAIISNSNLQISKIDGRGAVVLIASAVLLYAMIRGLPRYITIVALAILLISTVKGLGKSGILGIGGTALVIYGLVRRGKMNKEMTVVGLIMVGLATAVQ